MAVNKVKGTYDVLPTESKRWQYLEAKIHDLMKRYNFKEIRTPIFEYSEVFHRQSENSDMVNKETYDFLDRANRKITLRPEGTAGIIRSYVEHKLYVSQEVEKVYSIGPNFRYERPQKGRYRQFYQLNVEAIGASNPFLDAEIITLAYQLIQTLGLKEVQVKVNSLGDRESRNAYQTALYDYLTPYREQLSDDSKIRLDKNPLRILDSKIQSDQDIVLNAPTPIDYLNDFSKKYYQTVLDALRAADVTVVENPRLVRGLDYYSHTVFEIEASIPSFGAQNVLGGGGSYEHLIAELGGPNLGGIGFGFGLERLLYALEAEGLDQIPDFQLDVFVLALDKEVKALLPKILFDLRSADLKVDANYTNKGLKGQLKQALKHNSRYLLFLGHDELAKEAVGIKDTKTEFQEEVKLKNLVPYLKEKLGK